MRLLPCPPAAILASCLSVIFTPALRAVALKDEVLEGTSISSSGSTEEGVNEGWTSVINDTLTFLNAVKQIQHLTADELQEIEACVSENKTLEECTNKRGRRKRRSLSWLWTSLLKGLKSTLLHQVEKYIKSYKGNHSCYNDIGCFHPENRTGLEIGGPDAPDKIGTRFLFFSNQSSHGIEVNHSTWADYYNNATVDITKPLIGVVHGFTQDTSVPWMIQLKDALLRTVNCNVILVNWTGGAMFPNYPQAAANTPVPGVLLSSLLEEMMLTSNCSLMPDMMYVIGFSLGAHIAGFCGRNFNSRTGRKLGRITGLDPAGPLFEESNAALSRTDAAFVDIIHTSAGNLTDSRFGINKSIGHVDFYPNGGSNQPGCELGTFDFYCAHSRAVDLFTESLTNINCSFVSHYCEGGMSSYSDCKQETNTSYLGEMGYGSINKAGRGDQYLKTNEKPLYCIPEESDQVERRNT